MPTANSQLGQKTGNSKASSGTAKYYIDTRMSFGCRSGVDQWLRISSALLHALTRWGVHNLTYIDDIIFIAASKVECGESVRKLKALCKDWDVTLKGEGQRVFQCFAAKYAETCVSYKK